jgi:hypothetical protein
VEKVAETETGRAPVPAAPVPAVPSRVSAVKTTKTKGTYLALQMRYVWASPWGSRPRYTSTHGLGALLTVTRRLR